MENKDKAGKKRDTSAKRKSILDAAIRTFRDEGYESASMDRIAENAGASKRTVYNHFPSKDDLFQAVIDQFGQEMRSMKLIPYDTTRTLEEQLADFADAELAVVNDPVWMGFIKVLLSVFIRNPELARKAVSRHAASEDSVTAWIRAAALDGKLLVDDPSMAAGVFTAMMGGAFTWPAVYRGGLDLMNIPALKKELIDTFLCRYRRV